MHETQHTLSNGRPVTFTGEYLFHVTATTDDGQAASATVAARDEWQARTQLQAIQTTMVLNGQFVSYEISEVCMQHTIHTPSDEQLEHAWWDLMQGELGIAYDPAVRAIMQSMFDHVRRDMANGAVLYEEDGEQLTNVTSDEIARRMVAAYAALYYGA